MHCSIVIGSQMLKYFTAFLTGQELMQRKMDIKAKNITDV